MNRQLLAFLVLAFASTTLFATPNKSIGVDAFNRTVSAAAQGNAVFSPASFEIDCVVFCEACDALTRGKIAESLGVMTGLENYYRPIHRALTQPATNGFSMLTARAFCLPDERRVTMAYRQWLQRTFSTEMFSFSFVPGATCWFRSHLEGDMEDFEIPKDAVRERDNMLYSFFDLNSIRFSWKEPFPTNNTRNIAFRRDDGSSVDVPALCDVRIVETCSCKRYSIIRLPLRDGSWFYALMPNEGVTVRDIRGELASNKIYDLVTRFKSITDPDVSRTTAAIVLPIFDILSENNLVPAMNYFQFPLVGFERLEKGVEPKIVRQVVRFRIDEKGLDDNALAAKPANEIAHATAETKKLVLDRPFLFFVHHVSSDSIPVVGQFMGR